VRTILAIVILAFAVIMIAACGTQRRMDVYKPGNEDQAITLGRTVYKTHCDKCHPNGEAGVGLPLNNIYLPGFVTRYRVRSRSMLLWLGKMPAFKQHEISKEEMDNLIAYLKHMHHSKSPELTTSR
jgi:mono/diheme cytochrome c family protein